MEFAGAGIAEFGHHFVEHFHIVGVAEAADEDDGVRFRLLQQIGEFVGAVGRIDVDHDRADFGGGELCEHPLGIVGGPDANVLPLLDTQGHQPPGDALHFIAKLRVGVPLARLHVDQGVPVGEAGRLPVQHVADGAVGVHGVGHHSPSSCAYSSDSIRIPRFLMGISL